LDVHISFGKFPKLKFSVFGVDIIFWISFHGLVTIKTSSFKYKIFEVLTTFLFFKNNSQHIKIFIDNEGVVNLLSKHNNLSIIQLHQMGVKETVKELQHRSAADITNELK
jgi:hypothetical protein